MYDCSINAEASVLHQNIVVQNLIRDISVTKYCQSSNYHVIMLTQHNFSNQYHNVYQSTDLQSPL